MLTGKLLKITPYIITFFIGGYIGSQLFPKEVIKTVEVEKVKWKTKTEVKLQEKKIYVDRVKTKVVTRTITKKDGTVIVEKEDSRDERSKVARVEKDVSKKVAEKEQSKTSIKFESKSSFSLGIGADVLSGDFTPGVLGYSLHINKRVYSSPIWAGVSVNMDNNFKFNGAGIFVQWEF